MAALLGAQAGRAPFQMNAATAPAQNLGTPANIASLAGASQLTIPTDPAGNAYKAVRISASGAVWVNFSADGTAAVVGGVNCFLISPGGVDVIPPVGATKMSAIPCTGVTTPDICVIGLY